MSTADDRLDRLLRTIEATVESNNSLVKSLADLAAQMAEARSAAAPQRPPRLTKLHFRILDAIGPGSKLTEAQIAKLIGREADSGSLRQELAKLVKAGFLESDNRGYWLPERAPDQSEQPPTP